jgi:Sulfotransferase domain
MKDTLDFLIIGAQKAGTTSLFEYLRRHPQLSLPDGKELPFFSNEEARARGWGYYLSKAFALADPGSRWGTATPQYMAGGLPDRPNPGPSGEVYDERTIPLRIRERLPDVRMIAILRDPVERALSHHRMISMEGVERRSFDQAIDELLRPAALAEARRRPCETNAYVAWGEYGRILEGYFNVFSSEQILVLFTEELKREPESMLRRTFEFLGIRSDFTPENIGTQYRTGGSERRFAWLGTYSSVSPLAMQRALSRRPMSRRMWYMLPQPARRQIDNAFGSWVYRLDLWNRRTSGASTEPDQVTSRRLRQHFMQDSHRLAELIGTPPPWLNLTYAR